MAPTASTHDDRDPISFPGWKVALEGAELPPDTRDRFRRAIFSFLKRCKDEHAPASVALIRRHLAATLDPAARDALRWFYRSARAAMRVGGTASPSIAVAPAKVGPRSDERGTGRVAMPRRRDVPPVAAGDRGGADWGAT